ncbi:MAG TPA: ATP-binding domain-containing protein, partial [Actinoplanes sp.]|nr:ATP-binding domain-containing protein [Actinoplanes sp.]
PVFGEHPDFFLFGADEPEATAERVVDLVAQRIPRKFGISPREIQVLSPMHRGPAGAGTLNTLLQQALAPGRDNIPERRHGARVFRPGDKVIQIRNNYDKGTARVFNGTVGTITALSVTDQQLTVRTDEDEDIAYDFDELDELQHAYAITVHRSQGSEYPAVVVPLTTRSFQDHVSLRILKGRCMTRPASRLASAMSRRPARWWAPTARLRRPAMTRGPDLVRTAELSSR